MPTSFVSGSIAPASRTTPQGYDKRTAQMMVWLAIGLLAIDTFDGVLRYVLSLIGVPWLIYLKDGVYVGLALCVGLKGLAAPMRIQTLVLIIGLLFFLLYTALLGAPFLQIALSIKVMLPFFCGYALASCVRYRGDFFLRALVILALINGFGVLLNSVVDFPWVGLDYDNGFTTVSAARDWHTDGLRRLPGFTRASFSAACLAVYGLIAYAVLSPSRIRMFAFALVTSAVVALTTSKSVLCAIPILLCGFLFSSTQMQKKVLAWFSLAMVGVSIVCLGLAKKGLDDVSGLSSSILLSFVDRLQNSWPHIFALYETPHQWFLGLGLGSVGFPAALTQAHAVGPVDSFVLWMLCQFGVVGVVCLIAFVVAQVMRKEKPDQIVVFASACLCFFLTNGVTSIMAEQSSAVLLLGLAVGILSPMGVLLLSRQKGFCALEVNRYQLRDAALTHGDTK